MGSNDLNNESTPASTSLVQDIDHYDLTYGWNAAADSTGLFYNGSSAGADPIFLTGMPFPVSPFPWEHSHGTYPLRTHNISESSDNLMFDLNQLHTVQNLVPDLNSIDFCTNIQGRSLQSPEWNLNEVLSSDGLMNDSKNFHSYENHEINSNSIHIGGKAGGLIGMTRLGNEVDNRNKHWPEIKNFIGSKGSTTLFCGDHDGGCSAHKNHEGSVVEHGFQNEIDGNFLSLGMGVRTEVKSNYDLNCKEITGELHGAASGFQKTIGSTLNTACNLRGGFSDFQNNVGVSTSVGHLVRGLTSSNNYGRPLRGTDACPGSSQFHTLQKPQADRLCRLPTCSIKNLVIVRNSDANLDICKGFGGERDASSGPISSSFSGFLDLGKLWPSGLESESVRPSCTTTQLTCDQLEKRFIEPLQSFSSDASTCCTGVKGKLGNSIRQEHSGQFLAFKDAAAPAVDASAQLPGRKCVQPDGCSKGNSTVQTSKDLSGPTSMAGQLISLAKDYGLSQASDVLAEPSLKRRTSQPPPAAPVVQRRRTMVPTPVVQHRKTTVPTPTLPSFSNPPYTVVAPTPVPDSFPHVKWQLSDGTPQPIGEKCMLCKRDLSFTAEGPVYQPTVPPAVAVLPCGHTFHDHCLQIITPEDQTKNPPCIPCAIGEI